MSKSRADTHKNWMVRCFPRTLELWSCRSNKHSTSLQQRKSISLASFLQYPDFRSSCAELLCKKRVLKNFAKFTGVSSGTGVFCEFCKILKHIFFHATLLAFVSIDISYSNTVCNKSASEAWIRLVSFYGEQSSEILHCHMYFLQDNYLLH